MNARGKLNVAYFNGSIVLAAVAGVLTHSLTAFIAVLASGLMLSLSLGQIRPSPRPSPRQAPR